MRVREILEGTWSFPDTPEKVKKLKQVLSRPLPIVDAEDALSDIIGNDDLMDQLATIADDQPDAMANDTVMQWLRHNYHPIFVQLANNDDWEGNVRPEDELLDDQGYYTPLGHEYKKPH